MTWLLKNAPDVTAVFAGNDVVAYGAMQAVLQAGLRIPEDMSIVGFDDDYMSRFLNPPLTTMALPAAGHGAMSVELLIDRIRGLEGPPQPLYASANTTSIRSTAPLLSNTPRLISAGQESEEIRSSPPSRRWTTMRASEPPRETTIGVWQNV